jgi:N-acetyl-beta-hexosaminidase
MGTKNNPGPHDCYSRAEPDEPVFVLLGRDPVAFALIMYWVKLRRTLGNTEDEVLREAQYCALEMLQWAEKKGKRTEATRAFAETSTNETIKNYIEKAVASKLEGDRLFERVRKLEALCGRAADAYLASVVRLRQEQRKRNT